MGMPHQGEWKFVSVEYGVMCVIPTGIAMMLESFVDNLDIQQSVSIIANTFL